MTKSYWHETNFINFIPFESKKDREIMGKCKKSDYFCYGLVKDGGICSKSEAKIKGYEKWQKEQEKHEN